MFQITFVTEQRTVDMPAGSTLLEAMRLAKLTPDAPCGGKGRCGKCVVYLENGEKVLSCQTRISRDMQIQTAQGGVEEARILTSAMGSAGSGLRFDPLVKGFEVSVPPCPAGESTSDWTRFARALSQAAEQTFETVNPRVASALGPLCRQNGGRVFAVTFQSQVLDVLPQRRSLYMAAFDIGTTTVAGYLLRAEDGVLVRTGSCMNPQAQYGADVINRANYALEHGMEEISCCIREAVHALLLEMTQGAQAAMEDVYAVCAAGNTCMHHLFLGIGVDSLVHAPYNPAVSEPMVLQASPYGLQIHPEGKLLMLPNIAGFVGADTVACLVSTKLAEQKDWTLLIDIGTNGEMVLGKDHRMAACSTAAGPAFEGAGITCGMRGSAGAICKAVWEQDHWALQTVLDAPIRGICGSGLLDLAAELLRSGQMEDTGELVNGPSILLADEEGDGEKAPVTLEQKDIRQLQLAKAAIASGVVLLAKKLGIGLEEISQVWLAGAFGSFLSPESACTIGMIPEKLRGKITAVGNAAGEGAKQVLLDASQWAYAATVAGEAEFLELATMPEFQDLYVDQLLFPEQP